MEEEVVEVAFNETQDRVDVRDQFGKWCTASVLRAFVKVTPEGTVVDRVFVHWLDDASTSTEWDEWIDGKSETRFASLGTFTDRSQTVDARFAIGSKVIVMSPRREEWQHGVVSRVDGAQVRVNLEEDGHRYGYWYHIHTDEIQLDNTENRHELHVF